MSSGIWYLAAEVIPLPLIGISIIANGESKTGNGGSAAQA